MATTLTDVELAESLPDVLSRVSRGERFVIERNGEAFADLAPAATATTVTTFQEVLAKIGHLGPVGGGFADDLEAVHTSQEQIGPPPAWPK